MCLMKCLTVWTDYVTNHWYKFNGYMFKLPISSMTSVIQTSYEIVIIVIIDVKTS